VRLASGQVLGYCTNVHPYDDVAGMLAALEEHAAPLRERLGVEGPLGVGLWMPVGVARELARDPAPLRRRLDALGLHCFTANAFPYGDFHAAQVKDAVFRPTWADAERLDYTVAAAQALAGLLPEGASGSLSTHSGSYKPWGPDQNVEDEVVAGFLGAADALAALEGRSGRRIVLAIEPEPLSFLETTDEVVDLFTRRLLPAGDHARRHLGLCFDACHQAVEFEDMAASVRALREAGVPIAKVQLSSAVVIPDPAADRELMAPFADDRWFHQVVTRDEGGGLVRIPDLPQALADEAAAHAAEWRVHLHVPLFADPLDDEGRLRTTRPWLEELMAQVGTPEVTPHLEIETYSFAAIPAERRRALGAESLGTCLAKEFEWVTERLPRAPGA
jgi:sugar phosphate isomerase/epimerase